MVVCTFLQPLLAKLETKRAILHDCRIREAERMKSVSFHKSSPEIFWKFIQKSDPEFSRGGGDYWVLFLKYNAEAGIAFS
jgi:hypothetical protein